MFDVDRVELIALDLLRCEPNHMMESGYPIFELLAMKGDVVGIGHNLWKITAQGLKRLGVK